MFLLCAARPNNQLRSFNVLIQGQRLVSITRNPLEISASCSQSPKSIWLGFTEPVYWFHHYVNRGFSYPFCSQVGLLSPCSFGTGIDCLLNPFWWCGLVCEKSSLRHYGFTPWRARICFVNVDLCMNTSIQASPVGMESREWQCGMSFYQFWLEEKVQVERILANISRSGTDVVLVGFIPG